MVAAPGVPGGAVMAALGVLESVLGFSSDQLALMITLYVATDSIGTACNIAGDGAIAIVVDRFATRKTLPRSCVNQVLADGDGDGLGAGRGAEAGERGAEVRLYAVAADADHRGDFRVVESLCDVAQHLQLARRKLGLRHFAL